MDLGTFIGGTPSFSSLNGGFAILLVAWTLIWKGLSMWRAARRGENIWFIIFLILNTFGILEIIYYFLIAKADKKH